MFLKVDKISNDSEKISYYDFISNKDVFAVYFLNFTQIYQHYGVDVSNDVTSTNAIGQSD